MAKKVNFPNGFQPIKDVQKTDKILLGRGEQPFVTTIDDVTKDKVDKVTGKSLVDDTAITKLNSLPANQDLNNALDTKVDKVTGKGLSTNDFTNTQKAKVDNLKTSGSSDKFLNEKGEYVDIDVSQIKEWIAGTYNIDATRFLDGKIYRANKTTNQIPSTSSQDWDVIGGSTLVDEIESNTLVEIRDSEKNLLGYFDEEGVLNVSEVKEWNTPVVDIVPNITKLREVTIPELKFMRLDFQGGDIHEGEVQRGSMKISSADQEIIVLNVEYTRQGNNSALWRPKQLSVDFYNHEWKSVDVKFGDWIAVDGLHLKAYRTDLTNIRDKANSMLWRQMADHRPFPDNLIAPLGTDSPTRQQWNEKDYLVADAKFVSDLIPCEVYFNGSFRSLSSWKIKKTRENWAINRDRPDQAHWFFDSQLMGASIGRVYENYDQLAQFQEVKSPRNPTEETKGKMMDWFNWANDVVANRVDLRTTYQDRINLSSLLDYIISINLFGHWDTNGNNQLLASYDGKTMHWFLHDMDRTFGIGQDNQLISNGQTGFIGGDSFIAKARVVFLPELTARWKHLQNVGVIDMNNIYRLYTDCMKHIPRRVYTQDLERNHTTLPQVTTINQILRYLSFRIDWLNNQWK